MILQSPLVSVVVTTKNEEKHISNCLESIYTQSYDNIELIVIDNFSEDKTFEMSRKYTSEVHLKGPERSAQRNYGLLQLAQGKYAMFVDAYMILSSTLIQECVNRMTNSPDIDGIYLPEIVLGKRLYHKMRRFERSYYTGTAIDCVRFFSLEVCRQIHGFDELTFQNGSGEDWDFDKRMRQVGNMTTLYPRFYVDDALESKTPVLSSLSQIQLPACLYHNEEDLSYLKVARKKLYYASAFSRYRMKWGKHDPDILFQLSPLSRIFGIFLDKTVVIRTFRKVHLYFIFLMYKTFLGVIVSTCEPISSRLSHKSLKITSN
jgi:glycosyltransferase involved in cell wall biosynthesis